MAIRAAGYVIFRKLNEAREYLLLQASYEPHHWTTPKGHVDPGEDEHETAIRELKEESGITVSDITAIPDFKTVIEYEVNNCLKKVTYWIAELKDPNKQIQLSDEHQDFKWLQIEEACDLSGYKTSRALLKECDEFLIKNNY